MMLKILSLSIVKNITRGQEKQLTWELEATGSLANCKWDVMAFHDSKPHTSFDNRIPSPLRNLLGRRLLFWLVSIFNQHKYDYILYRYQPFDPLLPILGWFVKNRISIHHGKELNEFSLIKPGVGGALAKMMEHISGFFSRKQVAAIVGVTDEIVKYQLALSDNAKPVCVYANGINVGSVGILSDSRKKDINIAFICGKFSSWHGLDLLLDSFESYQARNLDNNCIIHLIGELSEDQISRIKKMDPSGNSLGIYGTLTESKLRSVLECCDVGLSSFALYRKGLKEASTLKVREYLAFGLPVYSGYTDVSIPRNFPFYKIGNADIDKIIQFALKMKSVERKTVRLQSEKYIDKAKQLNKLVTWLQSLRA